MVNQRNLGGSIKNTYVFDLEMSERGRRINDFAESLNLSANRDKFKLDSDAFMDRFELTAREKKLVIDNDWLNLVKAGGNIYNVIRIAALFNIGLYPMGAQQIGLSYEEFLQTRNVKGAT
ncbi:MAG: protocatechuate 3,4-dioxygenase [Rhodospirillaceae bacterium]|nr:protocatechuate 3,4-dioxygenase [Rhodospirillaceae bacterium]